MGVADPCEPPYNPLKIFADRFAEFRQHFRIVVFEGMKDTVVYMLADDDLAGIMQGGFYAESWIRISEQSASSCTICFTLFR